MRYLHRARFVQEAFARRLVTIGDPAQDPNRNRVTERAMDASVNRTSEPARAERLTELVGAEQRAGPSRQPHRALSDTE